MGAAAGLGVEAGDFDDADATFDDGWVGFEGTEEIGPGAEVVFDSTPTGRHQLQH